MLFVDTADFYQQADDALTLTRAEKAALSIRARQGDAEAKDALLLAYLPLAASFVRRHFSGESVSLHFIYRVVGALEELLERVDISQNYDTLISCFSVRIRQEITRYIAEEGGRTKDC